MLTCSVSEAMQLELTENVTMKEFVRYLKTWIATSIICNYLGHF